MVSKKNFSILLVVVLFFLFASLFGLSKEALNFSAPFFLIGSRMFISGISILIYLFIRNPKSLLIKLKDFKYFILLSFFGIYITNISEICGLEHMNSAKACLIYSLSPFIAILTSFLLLNEKPKKNKFLGLCVGFVGLLPIFTREIFNQQYFHISISDILLLVAVFSSVYGWTLLKKIVDIEYNHITANGISMAIGGSFALVHSYLIGESWDPFPIMQIKPFIYNTLCMCIISNLVCYNLFGYLLKFYSVTLMSFAGLMTPIFATFLGWYFLNEPMLIQYFMSIIIFSIGLIIFHLEDGGSAILHRVIRSLFLVFKGKQA